MALATQGKFDKAAGEIRTKGAMSPIVWLFAICSLVFVPVSLVDPEPLVLYTVLTLWALSGLAGISGFTYFMVTNPGRLQSKRQIARMTVLEQETEGG